MRHAPIVRRLVSALILLAASAGPAAADSPAPNHPTIGSPLPGTKPLEMPGDLASHLVDGADRFLQRKIDESTAKRAELRARDFASAEARDRSVEPRRRRLAHRLGVRDARDGAGPLEYVRAEGRAWFRGHGLVIRSVRWPAFDDVTGEGLELRPDGKPEPVAAVVVIPDADQTPEMLAGLLPGLPPERQVARRLAEAGLRVLVPALIDRTAAPRMGGATMTNREFLHRPAFVMGRTLIGLEVQKVLAAVDRLAADGHRVGVFGYGEGGGIALLAAALDPRIAVACASGWFDDRNAMWRQPLDRNVFGLLEGFGDADLALMIAPRPLIVEAARGPEFAFAPGQGGAPGRIESPRLEVVRAEVERASAPSAPAPRLVVSGDDGQGPFGTEPALSALLGELGGKLASVGPALGAEPPSSEAIAQRQARQVREIDRHVQRLALASPAVRREFMKALDASSPSAFAKTVEPYRERFATEIIGRFDDEMLPPNARSRQIFDEPSFTGFEVVLDVFPDVIATGILLMPKGIAAGERRPVVVCQHGLEGRPSDLSDPRVENKSYHRFAVRLAERGFITFSPQNPYIFEDRFRTLQRKANPIGKTLFSLIVPQHRRITDWLKTLDRVDPDRIGFYGLSYGGKSAMRIPPLVDAYRLSICSADFNDWVWKTTSTISPHGYVRTGEYEIFEFDLGNTFNYAEMAALIAPRPFMVERGHHDGVAPDEAVAYEFAKVFYLYDARLRLGDRCEIEVFDGPHEIHGEGTFRFLHRHLNWPEPKPR